MTVTKEQLDKLQLVKNLLETISTHLCIADDDGRLKEQIELNHGWASSALLTLEEVYKELNQVLSEKEEFKVGDKVFVLVSTLPGYERWAEEVEIVGFGDKVIFTDYCGLTGFKENKVFKTKEEAEQALKALEESNE